MLDYTEVSPCHNELKNRETLPYNEDLVNTEVSKESYHDENEMIHYTIVNKELNMSTGKIIAQCNHGIMLITLRDHDTENFQKWLNTAIKAVTLKGTEKEMVKLKELLPQSIMIIDKGFTEIPNGSKTILSLPVMSRKEAHQYVKKFRLL
jgi:peptidyl-tRNA hydrolase